MRRDHHDRGTIDTGVPMAIMAVLGAIALQAVWAYVPTWGRIVSILLIGVLAIAGFFMVGKGGFTKL